MGTMADRSGPVLCDVHCVPVEPVKLHALAPAKAQAPESIRYAREIASHAKNASLFLKKIAQHSQNGDSFLTQIKTSLERLERADQDRHDALIAALEKMTQVIAQEH